MSKIEKLKIDKAEVIQKYDELQKSFKELFEDAFFLWNWIKDNCMDRLKVYREKYNTVTEKWEFDK